MTTCHNRKPVQLSQKSFERKMDALLKEIHENNVAMMQCRHRTTGLLVIPGTDGWDGTILDGETTRICLDCKEVLEVLA